MSSASATDEIHVLHFELDVSVHHVNTQEGSPSQFSNKSYTLIIIVAVNQFVHLIIKYM